MITNAPPCPSSRWTVAQSGKARATWVMAAATSVFMASRVVVAVVGEEPAVVRDVHAVGIGDRLRAVLFQLFDQDEVQLDRDALGDRLLLDLEARDLVRWQRDGALVDVDGDRYPVRLSMVVGVR